jgi:hypothetical protein
MGVIVVAEYSVFFFPLTFFVSTDHGGDCSCGVLGRYDLFHLEGFFYIFLKKYIFFYDYCSCGVLRPYPEP